VEISEHDSVAGNGHLCAVVVHPPEQLDTAADWVNSHDDSVGVEVTRHAVEVEAL